MISSSILSGLLVLTAAPAPDSSDSVVQQARQEYRRGSMEKALGLYEKAISGGATEGRVFYEAGLCMQAVHGETAGGDMIARAVPVLESAIDSTPPPGSPEPFYYLATIYLHELGQGVKGVPIAQQAVKLYEAGSFKELAGPDAQFQMGRLFEMASRKGEAIPFYEKAIEGYDRSGDPDRNNLVIALRESAFARASKQEWSKAADHYGRLLEMTTLPERDRFSAGIVLLRADRFEAAEKTLQGFADDNLATEASYILRILGKYRTLGSPALPAEPAEKDDAWLQDSIMRAASDLGSIRAREGEEAEKLRLEWLEQQQEADRKEAAAAGKQSKYGPPPKPKLYEYAGPVSPPSEERMAAERRFFGLMAEYVRRGNLVRNFALSAGIAQLIFR